MPGNRGELHARFVSRMLRRDTDRRMDAEIPERVKRWALAGLAYHLGLAQRRSCPRDQAVEIVARRLGEEQAEEVVGACARHGLLAGGDPVWFAPHHTVQEHFAALALRDVAQREWRMGRWARLRRSARRLLAGQEEDLARLAADDWRMETFVQLAGLVDEADRLALEVARVNPWLAWWCVEEGRGVAEQTREAVADRSVRLLESGRVSDRRRAVAALARVRSERVVQPLFRAAADLDPEVAGLAVQALLEMGEAARALVAEALRSTNRCLWHAALRYLGGRPDDPLWTDVPDRVWEEVLGQPMIWVPPGPFLMGSDKGRDSQAYDGELPQHEVALPGYWIGRYPVTVGQFRAFVEASGHRPAQPRSLQRPNDHPMVWVTWYDALAFCRWLSEKAGLPVTLPSEAEWEKAARGTDGRIYPWGDEPPDDGRCNFENYRRGTTPVGRYSPQIDSPYGCADMAGNVWEWTRSLYREYPYDPGDGREDLEAGRGVLRVLRGGAFSSVARLVRCAARGWYLPLDRFWYFGFRLVASPVLL